MSEQILSPSQKKLDKRMKKIQNAAGSVLKPVFNATGNTIIAGTKLLNKGLEKVDNNSRRIRKEGAEGRVLDKQNKKKLKELGKYKSMYER